MLLGPAWLGACGGDDGDSDDGGDGDGGDVSFEADIEPVFAAKCVPCHHPSSATEVDLTDPFGEQGIVERPNSRVSSGSEQELLVDPGNVANSFIVRKVSEPELDEKAEGAPMPLQIAPLDEDELATVTTWVAAGAMDDASFDAVATIFGTDDLSIGPAAGKCTFCHPGPETGMDVIDPFDPGTGMVNVEADVGGTRVVPGDVEESVLIRKLEGDPEVGEPMPFNPDRLSADEIADLTAWIEAGAPNN